MAYVAILPGSIASAEEGLVEAEQRLSDSLESLEGRISELEKRPDWPPGAYCIVSYNKICPIGFTNQESFMKALSIYPEGDVNNYIRESGDSAAGIFIRCHGSNCRKHGQWTGEIFVNTCCKAE